MSRISLCLITKNEELLLGQCLESVRELVNEIVLIDTGSSDKTINIAKEFGARVYERLWDDDFSAPRNLGLEIATGDWILVLDADEAIAKKDHQELIELTNNTSLCYEFVQRHYSNDVRMSNFKSCLREYPEWERNYGGYFESALVRLFPHRQGINYIGRVHELVEHSINKMRTHSIVPTRIPIHHYGHTDEALQFKNKKSLYHELGVSKVKEDPHHWKNYFELGVEHNCSGRYGESVKAFLASLERNPRYVPTWVNLGYVLCEMGRYVDAEKSLRTALEIDPRSDEAYCNLGVVYLRAKHYAHARECFIKATEINPGYVNAYCNLGKAYVLLQDLKQAEKSYLKATELMPRSVGAQVELGAVYIHMEEFKKAEVCFKLAMSVDASHSRLYYYQGKLAQAMGNTKEAILALEKFCVLEEMGLSQGQGNSSEITQIIEQVRCECERLKEMPLTI